MFAGQELRGRHGEWACGHRRGGVGELGERHWHTPCCVETDGGWEAAAQHREPSPALRDDPAVGWQAQEGGVHVCM